MANIKVNHKDFISIVKSSTNWADVMRRLAPYGISALRSVMRRAKRHSVKPGIQHAHELPEGFQIKASSTLVGKDGMTKLQWLKLDRKTADLIEEIKQFAAGLSESIKGKSEFIPLHNEPSIESLLTNYIEPEPHYGMVSWAQETRENYDRLIAKDLLKRGALRLVNAAPDSKYALVTGLGDAMHADNQSNETSSGNKLDVDTRWGKLIRDFAGFYKWWIELLLTKHEIVYVKRVKGNHDDHSTTAINVMLGYMFDNNPRVIIDQTEMIVKYHRFGKNLLGITHGDKSKGDTLPLLMATDEPKAWGDTDHRYFLTGHIHHLSRKEYIGCVVESFRSVAAKDAWHAGQGYRAGREMVMVVLDENHGECERHTVNVGQIM